MTVGSKGRMVLTPLAQLILMAGVILAVTAGFRQVSGLYMIPVAECLGTGVEPYARSIALLSLVWGISGVFASALADRFGASHILIAGMCFMMIGYFLLYSVSATSDLTWSGLFIGLGVGVCGQSVMVGVIGRAASPEERSSALATISIAGAIGNFIALPYTQFFIETLGWQGSLLVVIGTIGCLLPIAALLKDQRPAQVVQRPQSMEEALTEAVRLPSYWLLLAGFFVCGFHVGFYAMHLPAYVSSLGMDSRVGVGALTMVGIANIGGAFLAGRAARRFQQRKLLSFIYVSRCFVFLGLLFLPKTPEIIIGLSTILGLFWLATFPLTSGLVATFFGTAWLALLFSLVAFTHQLGAFAGIWLAGALFDQTKSYDAMWWLATALSAIAALLHWPIKERAVPRLQPATA
jgi:predicted MFS family arabinose efflux permease